MASTVPLIYDELLDYLIDNATPQEILDFKPSRKAEARAAYLLEQNNAGSLSPAEKIELEQMLYFDRKLSVLKAKAAAAIQQ
ncbi:MAG: hypothetical protein OHK0046_20600 [Anaerolineae bacterium]